ncbi:MAG: hypothetical protein ACYDCQ_16550 [Dehalococcoidia bacterium]
MKTIHVTDDTRLGLLLAEARAEPLLLEQAGALFRLQVCAEAGGDRPYDPDAIVKTFDALAGGISEQEADAIIDQIYAARKAGSRPMSRP